MTRTRSTGSKLFAPALAVAAAGACLAAPALLTGSSAHAATACRAEAIDSVTGAVTQAPSDTVPAGAVNEGDPAAELNGVLFTQPTVFTRRGVAAPVWTAGAEGAVPEGVDPGPTPTTAPPAALDFAPAAKAYTVPDTACTTGAVPDTTVAAAAPAAVAGASTGPAFGVLPTAAPAIVNVNAARSLAYTGGATHRTSNTVRALSYLAAGSVLVVVARRRKVSA